MLCYARWAEELNYAVGVEDDDAAAAGAGAPSEPPSLDLVLGEEYDVVESDTLLKAGRRTGITGDFDAVDAAVHAAAGADMEDFDGGDADVDAFIEALDAWLRTSFLPAATAAITKRKTVTQASNWAKRG